MPLACLVACLWMLFGQDPNDPLVFAPGMAVGARLQIGTNVVPSDWAYAGKLLEDSSQDDKVAGFHLISLLKPGPDPKKPSTVPAGFTEVPCDFIGTTPVVTVFSQDGQKHKFTVDTGAVRSYMRASMAQTLNFGRIDPLPLCLYLPPDRWIHFKAEVDPSIGVLLAPSPDFPADGILGMNALSCLGLKIDYRHRKLWARVSSKPIDSKEASSELGVPTASKTTNLLCALPVKRQDSGRYTVDVSLGGKTLPLELDTGANVLGVSPGTLSTLTLEKVGDGQVLVENGTKLLSRYLAPDARVGDIRFLWPVVHEGLDPRADVGAFGPSVLPHQLVVIDYPGRTLFTLRPTDGEMVEQAVGQLVAGVVRLQGDVAVLDMPDIVGPTKAVLTKIQDQPTASVLSDLRLWNKGDKPARARLLSLYKTLGSATGHITILQDSKTITIEIGQPHL